MPSAFSPNRGPANVEQEIAGFQRRMNSSRYAPPMLPVMSEISKRTLVYVFNVGPWPQVRYLGSAGTFYIPACEEGKDVSAPVILQGIVREFYPISEVEMKPFDTDGFEFAEQIVGAKADGSASPHLAPRNSFLPYGVFATKNKVPTAEELAAARKRLNETFLKLINEADQAYARGPKAAEETINPDIHFAAARALHKTESECAWLRNSATPAARDECPSCGSIYKIGIMKCRECGYILDKPKHDAAVKAGLMA
jgi:hypothetical protein